MLSSVLVQLNVKPFFLIDFKIAKSSNDYNVDKHKCHKAFCLVDRPSHQESNENQTRSADTKTYLGIVNGVAHRV
jgi:hypothetical protein